MQTWPVRHALKPQQAARRASRMRAFFIESVETKKCIALTLSLIATGSALASPATDAAQAHFAATSARLLSSNRPLYLYPRA
jgi:hypothetical protein